MQELIEFVRNLDATTLQNAAPVTSYASGRQNQTNVQEILLETKERTTQIYIEVVKC